MRLTLRLAALGVFLAALVFWLFGGAHVGWTKTTVTRMEKDPVTEIEFPVTEDHFTPGVEFPVGGAAAGLVLFAGSFLFRTKKLNKSNPTPS